MQKDSTGHRNLSHFLKEDLRMVLVEGGAFIMGSREESFFGAKVEHKVQLSSFKMSRYLVTQRLWEGVMGNNPSYFRGTLRPVERVSWEDVQVFIDKLNVLLPGYSYRLPTEAEWEYAARGGRAQKQSTFTYAGSNDLEEVGWYIGNGHYETKEVGQKSANQLGLFDMSGNVFEWCRDWSDEDYYQSCLEEGLVSDPSGPNLGTYRIMRGGSWDYYAAFCRCAYRYDYAPDGRNYIIGFRLVSSLSSR